MIRVQYHGGTATGQSCIVGGSIGDTDRQDIQQVVIGIRVVTVGREDH